MGSGEGSAGRRITPVILSGGSGTRLWPLSRHERPKQMLALVGEKSMLELTVARAADGARFGPPVVVTAAVHADAVAAQLGSGVRLILEPCGRNTAAAIALAALDASPDELLLVMPSDHLIPEPERFLDGVAKGVPAAEHGMLVTFGVRPTRPETGYGYIRRGEPLADGVFRAARFLEKPDLATASAFVADGNYEWNSGIFLFSAGAYAEALAEYAPDILDRVRRAMAAAAPGDGPLVPDARAFAEVRGESIDRAVMERAANVAVVPVDVGWSDLGSWDALYAASQKDGAANSVSGPAMLLGASGCLVRSDGPQVVAIGVENLAIVATGDAVLVVPLDRSQRVSEAVARLAESDGGKRRDASDQEMVPRGGIEPPTP